MPTVESTIETVSSGIVHLIFMRNQERVSSGSGFISNNRLITNSHVLRFGDFDAVIIRFHDSNPTDLLDAIRLGRDDFFAMIVKESPEEMEDYAIIRADEPEYASRYNFELGSSKDVVPGQQVLFLGFPFDSMHLTAHVGYVSSKHQTNNKSVIQIDGSVNGGNSGGPLLSLDSNKVAGIVTRKATGLEKQFNALIDALRKNQTALEQCRGIISVGPVDPMEALRASQAAMERIALNIERSANVGIGYAYSAQYVAQSEAF
jgi:S1-C subfamily serine protease